MNKKRILICDDDEGILDMLSMALETDEITVLTEPKSLNMIPRIIAEKPDLVVLDLWMPVLSGDQILREIKRHEELREIPVIIISASIEGERIAMENGASDFIAKPFDLDTLHDRICGLMEVDC